MSFTLLFKLALKKFKINQITFVILIEKKTKIISLLYFFFKKSIKNLIFKNIIIINK